MNNIYIVSETIDSKKKSVDLTLTEQETNYQTIFCYDEIKEYFDKGYKVNINFQTFKTN